MVFPIGERWIRTLLVTLLLYCVLPLGVWVAYEDGKQKAFLTKLLKHLNLPEKVYRTRVRINKIRYCCILNK